MGLTSEQVHWVFGFGIAVTGLLLLWGALSDAKRRWVEYLVPVALTIFGVTLAGDPLIHGDALPPDYGMQMTQHFVLSGLFLVVGGIEFFRLWKSFETFVWRLPLVVALFLAAGLFAFHDASHAGSAMLLVVAQHRVIAATLGILACLMVVAAAAGRTQAGKRAESAFAALVVLLGVQFVLYTEGSMPGGMEGPSTGAQMLHSGDLTAREFAAGLSAGPGRDGPPFVPRGPLAASKGEGARNAG